MLRNIEKDHLLVCFKLFGVPGIYLEKTELDSDEMETIRLNDFESFYRQEGADNIGISCTTFSKLIESTHKKITDALLHSKAIVMTT